MINVGKEFKWPPEILGGLFYDRKDYKGILYWYDAIHPDYRLKKIKKK